jgi:uncharacterized protein
MTSSFEHLVKASRPRTRHAHWSFTEGAEYLLLVNGSRVFSAEAEVLARLESAADDAEVERLLCELGVQVPEFIDDKPLVPPPLHALSLAIAQKCNMSCTYCYASEGSFGGEPKNMPLDIALQAVETLVGSASPGARVNIAFLGGEPLVNRAVLRAATERAVELGEARGVNATFSITTNGTLLNESDGEFFEKHAFAVTVSLDGLKDAHDLNRRLKYKGGSFDRIMARVQPLLGMQRRMQVSVRSTVTPGNLKLREGLDYFLDAGFHSVGFSPVLRSPSGEGEMGRSDLLGLLDAMVDCGEEFERRCLKGQRYAFLNMTNALRELHRGTHRPYPCGAGAGYLGVSATGDLAACHRFVGDGEGAMGSLEAGIDEEARTRWLAERHVDWQTPCSECWARYLCGGGCHHEVIARGRVACDYIRGWLHYCLEAYVRLLRARPEWFGAPFVAPHAEALE